MENLITLKSSYPMQEVRSILNEALTKQINFAHARLSKFDTECRIFEEKYKISSDKFYTDFESGQLGDDIDWFDWYAAFRGRTIWETKCRILGELSWNE